MNFQEFLAIKQAVALVEHMDTLGEHDARDLFNQLDEATIELVEAVIAEGSDHDQRHLASIGKRRNQAAERVGALRASGASKGDIRRGKKEVDSLGKKWLAARGTVRARQDRRAQTRSQRPNLQGTGVGEMEKYLDDVAKAKNPKLHDTLEPRPGETPADAVRRRAGRPHRPKLDLDIF